YQGFRVIFRKDIYTEEYMGKLGLNERQIKAIMYVKEKGKITNKEYREINNISDEGARKDLKILVNKKLLCVKGKGRNVHYVLVNVGN
ncbi:MAG: DeoR family transcriptional regulator, partial [Methanosarcinales archaeon]